MNNGNTIGLGLNVARIEEETTSFENFVDQAVEDGAHMNPVLSNIVMKQENESIKLQYAMEKIDTLTERLASIMGNTGDLVHFMSELKDDKELTREKIRECNEKNQRLTIQITALSDRQDNLKAALEKRQHTLELATLNLDNEIKSLKYFKKQQLKLLGDELATLSSFKGGFERKVEFMHERFEETTALVHSKMS